MASATPEEDWNLACSENRVRTFRIKPSGAKSTSRGRCGKLADWILSMLIKTMQHAKRLVEDLLRFPLLPPRRGVVFTPGPRMPVILFGLGVLAAEFVWARTLLD